MNIEDIWSEYRIKLKAFLHAKISNPVDVDDLLQEIMIKTHQNLHTIKSQSSIKSWLFQIANHTVIDFYRSNKNRDELTEHDLWYGEDKTGVKSEFSKCVEPFIRALPEKTAELLTAIDINDVSQKMYAEEQSEATMGLL